MEGMDHQRDLGTMAPLKPRGTTRPYAISRSGRMADPAKRLSRHFNLAHRFTDSAINSFFSCSIQLGIPGRR